MESIDVLGTSYIYASGTTTNPGPLTSLTIANETAGTTRRICEVPLQGNSKVRNSPTIFFPSQQALCDKHVSFNPQ